MTAVSPPDAKLSTIGQWAWLILLKEEEVSLTPQQLISLLQGPLLIQCRGDTFILYALWVDLLGLFSQRSGNKRTHHWQGWEILPQNSGGCTSTITVLDIGARVVLKRTKFEDNTFILPFSTHSSKEGNKYSYNCCQLTGNKSVSVSQPHRNHNQHKHWKIVSVQIRKRQRDLDTVPFYQICWQVVFYCAFRVRTKNSPSPHLHVLKVQTTHYTPRIK